MYKINRNILKLLFAILLFFTLTGYAFARAGGGESYGDGGFDTGSDFGGSSSFDFNSGSSIPISSGGENSCCSGIIIIIIIIIFIYLGSRRRKNSIPTQSNSDSIDSNHTSMDSSAVTENLLALKRIDPKFDEQKFKTHSKKVFMAVQKGWTDRDQSICRPFMAEEVFQSHQIQIDNMKKGKIINILENIVVGSTSLARIDIGDEYHKITVKIKASMKDYKVSEDNPKNPIEGDKRQSPPFTEYWTFIRRSNLKTKLKDGLFDRKCPNCGAPINVSVSGICKYCDANVVNGDYDWVLSEITQKSEWSE